MTFSLSANSKVLKNQVTGMKRSFFSLKETCKFMGYSKNLLLIDIKGSANISCMIHDVNLTEFCLKKMGDTNIILRGHIDKLSKKVVCEQGEAVNLSMTCSKEKICKKSAKLICKTLRPIFANQLILSHHSKLKKNSESTVNCYFAKDSKISIDSKLDLNL